MISTEIASAAHHVGEEKAIEYVAKAGFDAWDFSMFSMLSYDWKTHQFSKSDHPLGGSNALAFARKLRQIGLDNGIVCNQSHAPFPCPVDLPMIREYLKRAIECTAEAGGKICIIHPDNNATPEANAEMYGELLPWARSCGVKIAAENMWNWDQEKDQAGFAACCNPESFLAHLHAVDDEFLVACLDIGHSEMKGLGTSAPQLIHALGNKLQALHLHDNDRWHDSHQIPFSMEIDFGQVVRALQEIGYQGDFTLECDQYLHDRTPETLLSGLQDMAAVARKLEKMFQEA